MSEGEVVQKTEVPATIDSLQADFRALGIRSGMVLLVHSSLRAMGWVCGGVVFDRTKPVGESARARIVVAGHTCDNASLPSGFDVHPVNGGYPRNISKATGLPA